MRGFKQGSDTTGWKMDWGRLSKIRKKEISQEAVAVFQKRDDGGLS